MKSVKFIRGFLTFFDNFFKFWQHCIIFLGLNNFIVFLIFYYTCVPNFVKIGLVVFEKIKIFAALCTIYGLLHYSIDPLLQVPCFMVNKSGADYRRKSTFQI